MENLTLLRAYQIISFSTFLSRSLTAEEEAGQGFVSGNDWQIMTEEEYQAQQGS